MKREHVDTLIELQNLISEVAGEQPMGKQATTQLQPIKGHCSYCGEYRVLTRDHFYPQLYLRTFLVGNNPAKWEVLQDDRINIVKACKRCQKWKGAMLPKAWLNQMPKTWKEGREFVRNKINEIDALSKPVTFTRPTKEPEVSQTFAKRGQLGPTRDWTPVLNEAIKNLVAVARPATAADKTADERRYTHVYVGATAEAIGRIDKLNPETIKRRLQLIGAIKLKGKEAKKQPRSIWLIENAVISSADASRADTLARRQYVNQAKKSRGTPKAREAPKEPAKAVPPMPRVEVEKKPIELSPDKPAMDYAALLSETRRLDNELDKARHRNEILRDEKQELQDHSDAVDAENDRLKEQRDKLVAEIDELNRKLAAAEASAVTTTGDTDLAAENTRLKAMVQNLLVGDEWAQMLQEAARLGRSS